MNLTTKTVDKLLTKTSGFLGNFTHTINPYKGCALGKSFCGSACYASLLRKGDEKKEVWGNYLVAKENAAAIYLQEIEALQTKQKKAIIFMSTITDPYPPQEKRLRITRSILEAMNTKSPDGLVIQTHTPNPLWDIDLLEELNRKTRLSVHISVETDMEKIPPFRPHAYAIHKRIEALDALKKRNIHTVATVSPLMPLRNPTEFATTLKKVCNFVIVNDYSLHYGTDEEQSHLKTAFMECLQKSGNKEWLNSKKFAEIFSLFCNIIGSNNVGTGSEGFNFRFS